jgi:regulatory protein
MPKKPAPSLMGRALRFLSKREQSLQELRKKLLPFADSESELDELLLKLQKQDWLSDERFAEGLVRRKSERYGSRRIVDELKQNGIDQETVSRLKNDLKESDAQRAHDLWQKKFDGLVPVDQKDRAKQMRYLASKGFPLDQVSKIITGRYLPSDDQFE